MWREAEKFLAKDKYIGPFVTKYGPCKIKKRKKSQYFPSLVSAIVGQQLSGKAASTIYGRLEKELGGEVVPEKILRKRDATLRKCGLSFAKIKYVKDLSRKVKSGEVEIHKMGKLTDEKIIEELTLVKGIGQWTAEMFLMFSLARPDVFPVDDLGIRKGLRLLRTSGSESMKKLLGKDLNKDQMVDFAERWKPCRTVASWYLWRAVDN